MKKEIILKKLPHISLVAHRLGYAMTNFPENSIMVLETIFNDKKLLNSCNGFEFDICFTKDNIPVVIHDKHIDDVSNGVGMVRNYTFSKLKELNFGFRKTLNINNLYSFKILSLEEILTYFLNNYSLLGKKIIKIETKEACRINIKNMYALADILNKYPTLSKNIIHLSYWPQNLMYLRKIQKKKNYYISKTDLLCDFNFIVNISKFLNHLDYISLRVRTKMNVNINSKNTYKVNKQLLFEKLFINYSDAANSKTIKYAINRFGTVNLYVINQEEDIETISKIIDNNFFKKHWKQISLTTNNPIELKNIKKNT